ncbi:MAG: helix-turn-helix transcriptional regulator [Acidobacteria bacterium]|nr:helix-turn-helix transcriptional regulator [Acidobacteriota bacterium]
MQNIRIRLGARVREFRKNLGWSQEKLGEKAELHPTYVGGIERGERNVSLDNLVKISEAFKIGLAELFQFPEEEATEDGTLREKIRAEISVLNGASLKFVLGFVSSVGKFKRELVERADEPSS